MSNRIGFVETPAEISRLMVELSDAPKDARVMDVGCGNGVFLKELQNQGFENCTGIEIDKDLHNVSQSQFEHYKIINGDYLTYHFPDKFDLIIGNPPYVHYNHLPRNIANNVRNIIKTTAGDIYYAFIIKSLELLKEGGELIFIVPYHFFYNTYARYVRDTIFKQGKIEIIIDLDETSLFFKENPETVIIKFRKGVFNIDDEKIKLLKIKTKKTPPLKIMNKSLDALQNNCSNNLFDYQEIKHYANSDQWSTYIMDIPDFPFVQLKDIAKVGVGFVSGFDDAFRINKEDIPFLNDNEKELVKYFVKGKNCQKYIIDDYVSYILIEDDIRDEGELRDVYPHIYKKLIPYKAQMTSRYILGNKQWFHWQALRNYKFLIANLNKKKIYVPTLDRHSYNRFSLGDEDLLPSGDILFIQPFQYEDIYFLLGYLNSDFFRKYYLAKGARRGGRVSFTQRLLDDMNVPIFPSEIKDKISQIVKEIIMKLENKSNVLALEKELDRLIYKEIEKNRLSKVK